MPVKDILIRILCVSFCLADRLGDLSIQFGSTTTPPEIATYSGTFPLEDTIQFDMPYTGRYLRISMARTEFLTICELELYGFAAITSMYIVSMIIL